MKAWMVWMVLASGLQAACASNTGRTASDAASDASSDIASDALVDGNALDALPTMDAVVTDSPPDVATTNDGGAFNVDSSAGLDDVPVVGIVTETCPVAVSTCTPVAGTTGYVLLQGTVVTPDRVVCDGSVLFSTTGRIVCVGDDCASAPEAMGAQVVCAQGVILPGVIDPHQHADYDHLPVFQHTARYDNRNTWRNHEPLYTSFKIPHQPFSSTSRTGQQMAERWAEMRITMAGGTAISGTAGELLHDSTLNGLVRNVDALLPSATGLPGGAFVDPDIDSVVVHTGDGSANLADTSTHLMAVATRMAMPAYRAFLPHLAEGIDANARAEFDVADSFGVINAKTAIVHCLACSTTQLAHMASVHSSLVWSPQSNLDLYGLTASVTTAHALGVTITLGVDWTPSGSADPLGELRCADQLNTRYYDHAFTDTELVAMVTSNAASAMHVDDVLGRIEVGHQADLTVIAGDRTHPYRALINARPEQVRLVIVGGVATYGDPDAATGSLVASASCMAVPDGLSTDGSTGVCGSPKVLCAAPDDITALREAITMVLDMTRAADTACAGPTTTGTYCYAYNLFPLFQCGGPTLDRCVMGHPPTPRRDASGGVIPAVSGVAVPGTDSDGDGVPDATDNCPGVFNPPFDLDTTQDDMDGDGLGDVCDPSPCVRADGTDACTTPAMGP